VSSNYDAHFHSNLFMVDTSGRQERVYGVLNDISVSPLGVWGIEESGFTLWFAGGYFKS
jgi:hypothetical protein